MCSLILTFYLLSVLPGQDCKLPLIWHHLSKVSAQFVSSLCAALDFADLCHIHTHTLFRKVYLSCFLYRNHCMLMIPCSFPVSEPFPIPLHSFWDGRHRFVQNIYQFIQCLDVFSVLFFTPFLAMFNNWFAFFYTAGHREDIFIHLLVITVATAQGSSFQMWR